MRGGKGVVCLLWVLSATAAAQQYPAWFLEQGKVPCTEAAVGYAEPSYYRDSSAALAFRRACENFVKYRKTKIAGGQTFWSTEIGTYWMGSDYREEVDSVSAPPCAAFFKALDTLFSPGLVAVLVGSSNCALEIRHRRRQKVADRPLPEWTSVMPSDGVYYYAVGVAPEYFHEKSSWEETERTAWLHLARSVSVGVKALQKVGDRAGEEVRHEVTSVILQNVQVVARWRDVHKKVFYVLMRMPKR